MSATTTSGDSSVAAPAAAGEPAAHGSTQAVATPQDAELVKPAPVLHVDGRLLSSPLQGVVLTFLDSSALNALMHASKRGGATVEHFLTTATTISFTSQRDRSVMDAAVRRCRRLKSFGLDFDEDVLRDDNYFLELSGSLWRALFTANVSTLETLPPGPITQQYWNSVRTSLDDRQPPWKTLVSRPLPRLSSFHVAVTGDAWHGDCDGDGQPLQPKRILSSCPHLTELSTSSATHPDWATPLAECARLSLRLQSLRLTDIVNGDVRADRAAMMRAVAPFAESLQRLVVSMRVGGRSFDEPLDDAFASATAASATSGKHDSPPAFVPTMSLEAGISAYSEDAATVGDKKETKAVSSTLSPGLRMWHLPACTSLSLTWEAQPISLAAPRLRSLHLARMTLPKNDAIIGCGGGLAALLLDASPLPALTDLSLLCSLTDPTPLEQQLVTRAASLRRFALSVPDRRALSNSPEHKPLPASFLSSTLPVLTQLRSLAIQAPLGLPFLRPSLVGLLRALPLLEDLALIDTAATLQTADSVETSWPEDPLGRTVTHERLTALRLSHSRWEPGLAALDDVRLPRLRTLRLGVGGSIYQNVYVVGSVNVRNQTVDAERLIALLRQSPQLTTLCMPHWPTRLPSPGAGCPHRLEDIDLALEAYPDATEAIGIVAGLVEFLRQGADSLCCVTLRNLGSGVCAALFAHLAAASTARHDQPARSGDQGDGKADAKAAAIFAPPAGGRLQFVPRVPWFTTPVGVDSAMLAVTTRPEFSHLSFEELRLLEQTQGAPIPIEPSPSGDIVAPFDSLPTAHASFLLQLRQRLGQDPGSSGAWPKFERTAAARSASAGPTSRSMKGAPQDVFSSGEFYLPAKPMFDAPPVSPSAARGDTKTGQGPAGGFGLFAARSSTDDSKTPTADDVDSPQPGNGKAALAAARGDASAESHGEPPAAGGPPGSDKAVVDAWHAVQRQKAAVETAERSLRAEQHELMQLQVQLDAAVAAATAKLPRVAAVAGAPESAGEAAAPIGVVQPTPAGRPQRPQPATSEAADAAAAAPPGDSQRPKQPPHAAVAAAKAAPQAAAPARSLVLWQLRVLNLASPPDARGGFSPIEAMHLMRCAPRLDALRLHPQQVWRTSDRPERRFDFLRCMLREAGVIVAPLPDRFPLALGGSTLPP